MKKIIVIISTISFLFSESHNNGSFTLSTGISPFDLTENLFSGVFLSLLGYDSEIEHKGINFNYRFPSEKRLSYGICSSYQRINEIFYDSDNDIISKEVSHYYIAGPMLYFNWRKGSKIMDISTNLGLCFIYFDRPSGYEKTSLEVMPQVDLLSINLGEKHSLNLNFGAGIQYFIFGMGYTYKL